MKSIPDDKQQIINFFSSVEPWRKAYSQICLSYFAVHMEGKSFLLQARLSLNVAPSTFPQSRIETASVLAGHFDFSEMEVTLENFVECLLTESEINTPHGKFIFPSQDGGRVNVYVEPFNREALANGSRRSVLTISGASKYDYIDQTKYDWELKAASQPFESLHELLSLLGLGSERSDSSRVELVANHVAYVSSDSVVSGAEAKPSIFLAKLLDHRKCQIGYRVLLNGKAVNRGSIPGETLSWSERADYFAGEGWVAIPQGAVLHCIASYDGVAQHEEWIADPTHSQNPRRIAFEEFDDQLEILRDYLFEELKQRKNSHDFEFGVAWLLWMLGFSVNQVGGTPRTSDAADILAVTPQGNILVVECTVGLLKAENKLAKLVGRSEAVKKRLAASSNSHLKLLPVIVTAKTRDEIAADLEQAQKLGMFVLTQENLRELLQQTIAAPNAESIYDHAWDEVQPKLDWMGPFAGKV